MNNITKRLILAGIFIPLLLIFIFWTPWFYHGLFNLLIILFAFQGGRELAEMLNRKGFGLTAWVAGIISALPAAAVYVGFFFPALGNLVFPVLLAAASLILLREAFPGSVEKINGTAHRIPGYLMILIYPGFFLSYMVRLSSFEESSAIILLFIALVFCNDSFAYIFGMLLGKKNRGIFKVSPNKSLAGFFGGLGGTVAAAIITNLIFPGIFNGKIAMLVFTALSVSLLAVAGDLIESAFKRSAAVKDSGNALKGRGGAMDSLDSLLYCAPLFYYLMKVIQ